MEKRNLFIRLAMIEQKTYDEIAHKLGDQKSTLSKWWEKCAEERKRIEWIRNLYNRKHFIKTTLPDFYDRYTQKEKMCSYCGIKENEITKLVTENMAYTKRLDTRERNLELERKNPNESYDEFDNLELSCYWCNNAKSDEFTSDEFRPIGREIGKIMRRRLARITLAVSDEKTNFLYLSGLLKTKYGPFYKRRIPVLEKNHIDFGFLPNSKDMWAKDYTPIQVTKDRFIQFRYEPDYLVKHKKYKGTISDVTEIRGAIGVNVI